MKFITSCIAILCLLSELKAFSRENELQGVDQKIKQLEHQLKTSQLHTMQERVEGQDFMIADWDAYGGEVEMIRQREMRENKLKEELNLLKGERDQLLKPQPR